MLKNETLTRQLSIIPMEVLNTPVTIIGAGAIGSHTALALAKMGMTELTVFDDDTVAYENMNNQGYPISMVGVPKVEALAKIIKEYTETDIKALKQRYAGEVFPGIVVSAVDNMKTRKEIWEAHATKAINTIAVIDPRMGAEQAMLFTMNPMEPKDQKGYGKVMYSDEDAMPEACTAKATIYTAYLLSGMVCKAIKDTLIKQKNYPRVMHWNIRENDFKSYCRPEDTVH